MTPKLADKLSKLIRLLASDKPGEVISTVNAIQRSLASEGLDLHDLANRLTQDSPPPPPPPPPPPRSDPFADFAEWARVYEARQAARDAERAAEAARRAEAERAARAAEAAEKAARAAARAAERQTPKYKARVAQRRRDALARKAAERAAEAERAEAERKLSDRIAAEGPKWDDIGDAVRRAWISKILRDPSANLDPSTREALTGIDEALAPPPTRAMRRGRSWKPKISWEMITPAWIAEFEKAARDHATRYRGVRQ